MKKLGILLGLICFVEFCFSQACPITESVPATCNCDDCGVLNETWVLTSAGTSVCEGEVFEIEAEYDDIQVDIAYFRWAVYMLDFSEVIIDTTIFTTNLFQYQIELGEIVNCAGDNDKIDFYLNLIVYTEECSTGKVSCHNALKPLTVEYKPRAKFGFSNLGCINEDIIFTDSSCFATTYEWDFNNDGIIDSTDPNPSYSYTNPGTYTVTLNVENDNECGSDTKSMQIEILGLPDAEIDLSVNDGEICNPDYLTLELDANEWVSGSTGDFNWSISPGYTDINGDWCFVDPDYVNTSTPCLHDSSFTDNTIDSLYDLDEVNLYFQESGEYTITLDYGNICETKTITETIYVFEPPSIIGLNDMIACDAVTICYDDLGLTIPGDYVAVQWTFTNGSINGSSDLDFGCVTFTTSGTITLDVEARDPCMDISQTIDINIVTTQEVSIPNPVPNIICQNSGLIPLFPSISGGDYIYNGSEATFIDNTTHMLDPSGLAPMDYTITYLLGGGTDCPSEDDFSFTIQEGPSVTLGQNSTFCESVNNFNPNITSQGGDIDEWEWTFCNSDGDVIFTSMDEDPMFDYNIPDSITIKLKVTSDECGMVLDSSVLIIQANVPAVIEPFNNPYCTGSSPDTLMAFPPGGTWTGAGIVDATAGVFDPSGLAPNSYEITYTTSNPPCDSEATATIIVVASEQVFAPDTFLCISNPPITLNVMPSGGIFSGTGITDSLNGIFDPGVSGVGPFEVIYNYTDANSCNVLKEIIVEVDSIPEIMLNDTVFVCIGNDDIALESLVDIDTGGDTGDISYSGIGIVNAANGIFNGGALNTGFYTITINFQGRSCATQDSFVIELDEKPELIIPPDMTVCITEGSLTLEANIDGQWSSPNCEIDPDTGEIDLVAIGEEICVFQYTVSPGTSCEQTEEVEITILDLDDDLFVPNDTRVCFSQSNYTFSNFGPLGGTWSGEGITDSLNGTVDLSQLTEGSSYTYTYCIESEEVDCEACKETTLAIEALPIADFEIEGSPCENQTFDLINNSSANAETFCWDFGDTETSKEESPSHIYTEANDYIITLIATTGFGCSDTTTQEVHVTAPPTIDVSITTEDGCAPLEIEYTNNSSGEGIIQYWVIDGIDTLFAANPIIILDGVITDSLITLQLVVSNDCETLTQSKDILVHPYPIVDFGINDGEGCSPDTVYFMNATVGLPEDFKWDFGNGNMSTEIDPDPPYQIYSSPDDSISTYYISLYASNMCGESDTIKEIKVYPNNVDAFFEIDKIFGCPPLEVTITNYATIGSTVSYNFGDGGTGNTPDTTYVYTQPGKYVITQYAALCGQDSIQSDTITVYPLPNIAFDLPSFTCAGDTAKFFNMSTDAVTSEWHFGDGNTSNDTNPSHIYTNPGTYEVSLIMYSIFNNCPDTLTKSILIPELPVADFEVDPKEICPNDVIQFTNLSQGAQDFEWSFGDSSGSIEENPTHVYTEPGTYEVTLVVYDDDYNCSDDTTKINVFVHDMPSNNFVFLNPEICQFYDTLLILNNSEGYTSSLWSLNGDSISIQQDSLKLIFDEFGTQNIELISTNAFTCSDTSSIDFEVLPSPIAESNFIDTAGCEELRLNFINLSQNSNLFTWSLDGINTAVDSNLIFTYEDEGQYAAVLIASNTNNCPSDSLEINIEVYPRAISKFEIIDFDSCGYPIDLFFTNLSEDSNDYDWDFGNGSSSNLLEPSTTYNQSGDYTISLIANNPFGCPDTSMTMIDIYPQPFADIDLPKLELCEGDTLVFNNNSQNSTTFEFYLNGNEVDNFPITINENGEYSITFIANYEGVCSDTFEFANQITVYDSPTSAFSYISNESEAIIGDVRFINLSEGAESYLWNFGDGNNSTEQNPTHEYDRNGPINVCLYAYNTNNGEFTCIDKSIDLIEYEIINSFFVPNALSPEKNFGNQEVGIFKPKGIGIKEYELNIFSPWGDKIITLNEVINGEPEDFWDGTFRGKLVPQGSYLWTARIEYESGNFDFFKGNVTVIR